MSFASYETAITSFAQAREDVVLIRSLRDIPAEVGFYIDVGVYHPERDSVTKVFYDAGWRGINIEPSPELFQLIRSERPRDINLPFAASSQPGEFTFFRDDGGQLGTLEERFAPSDANGRIHSQTVPAARLTDICEQHAPGEIHFLKIDVEGHERSVLEGMDFSRFRPWILVIEAVAPNTHNPTYGEWEHLVSGAGYQFVLADAINRFYLAEEKMELAPNFALLADNYDKADRLEELRQTALRLSQAEAELSQLRPRSERLSLVEVELAALKSAKATNRAWRWPMLLRR